MNTKFYTSFRKEFDKIKDRGLLAKIEAVILEVEQAEFLLQVKNIKKLSGTVGHYRIRVGDYRIGIHVDGNTVHFVHVSHRKEIYRVFP